MFECIVAIDHFENSTSTVLRETIGEFADERVAVAAARHDRAAFIESGRTEYAWWMVRQSGEQLARWIADSRSTREFVLDMRSGQLVKA